MQTRITRKGAVGQVSDGDSHRKKLVRIAACAGVVAALMLMLSVPAARADTMYSFTISPGISGTDTAILVFTVNSSNVITTATGKFDGSQVSLEPIGASGCGSALCFPPNDNMWLGSPDFFSAPTLTYDHSGVELALSTPVNGINYVILDGPNEVCYSQTGPQIPEGSACKTDTFSGGGTITPTPEPGTASLTLIGLIGVGMLGFVMRKRKAQGLPQAA